MRRIATLAAALVTLSTTAARAQLEQASVYSTTVYREGPGLRLGDGSVALHAGVSLENGYDSNIFYSASDPIGAGILRLRMHFDLAPLRLESYETDQSTALRTFEFKLSSQIEYREYESGNDAVRAQRSLIASFIGEFTLFPRGPIELTLSDMFARTVDPTNSEGPGSYVRDFNRVGVLGIYRYGALESGVSNSFDVNYWETRSISFADHVSDEAQGYTRIRFLPQTVGSLVVRGRYVSYGNNPDINATQLRAIAGATTLIDEWVGVTANVGYGNSFNATRDSYSGPIGNLGVRFFLPYRISAMVGYDRDFQESMFANFYTDDAFLVSVAKPLVSALSAQAGGSIRFRHYGPLISPMLVMADGYSSSERNDRLYEAHAELDYRMAPWLALGVNYNLLVDDTNFEFLTNLGPEPVHYVKHSVFARADFAY
jgi:hypothetical protein